MKNLSDLLKRMIPALPGCSEPMAVMVLAEVANDFCRRSCVLQTAEPQSLQAGVSEYDVDTPPQTELARVMAVYVNGAWCKPVSTHLARSGADIIGAATGDTGIQVGTPWAYFMKTPTTPTITVFPQPERDAADALIVRAAFAPKLDATAIDDLLFAEWGDYIAKGATARLMLVPGQPFSNGPASEFYLKQYKMAVDKASIQARRGRAAASLRVVGRSFA